MISRETCKRGDEVLMGRPNGQKARCRIKSVNVKTCAVELLEEYGAGRGSGVGRLWRVPFSMLYPVDGSTPAQPTQPAPIPRFLFCADRAILEAIGAVYAELSPENLACDGELSPREIVVKHTKLTRQLDHLQKAAYYGLGESNPSKIKVLGEKVEDVWDRFFT